MGPLRDINGLSSSQNWQAQVQAFHSSLPSLGLSSGAFIAGVLLAFVF